MAALASCAPSGADSDVGFVPAGTFHAGIHPNSAAVGDFDGDGDADAVSLATLSSHIVMLENVNGDLVSTLSAPLAVGAIDVIADDLNGDGRDEIIICHDFFATDGEASISVLTLDADKRWQLLATLPLANASYIAKADLDDDGDNDFAVIRLKLDDLVVIKNTDGALEIVGTYPITNGPTGVSAYRNHEQSFIAVVSAGDRAVTLYRYDAQGLSLAGFAGTDEWPITVHPIDLDGNSEPELVGAANLGNSIFVATIPPAQGPSATMSIRALAAGAGALDVAAVDVDHDGDLDLAVSNKNADTLGLWQNDDGNLTLHSEIPTRPGPSQLRVTDFNADGRDDLLVVDAFNDSVSVFYGQ